MKAARLAPALLAWPLLACSAGGQPAPAWPETPSPSYPAPPPTDGTAANTAVDETPPPGKPKASTPANLLAKEYAGREAESRFEGKATYYADSLAGNHTASGEVYDPKNFTAAHKKLPFGTVVRVVRTDTGQTTYAKVNDRGPFGPADRVIDLSRAAATELEMLGAGVVPVRVEVLETPEAD